MNVDAQPVRLSSNLHSFIRGHRLFLVNGESLGWAAIPLKLAPALSMCDGKTTSEIESGWNFPQVTARDFLEKLAGASLLETDSPQSLIQISSPTQKDHGKAQVFILKLTEKCNLRCEYCYDEAAQVGKRMSIDTFKASIDYAFSSSARRPLHFHFHGGEPLTNWPVFVEGAQYIRDKERAENRSVSLSTATNGFLLNDEKMDVLASYNFGIRLSFDGTPELNDLYRRDTRGEGTSGEVLRALDLVGSHPGIQTWCVLTTVTQQVAPHLAEVAAFLQARNVPSVELMPCRLQGHAQGKEELRVDPAQYVAGLKQIVEMIEEGSITSLRVEALIRLMMPLLTNDFVHASCGGSRCGAGRDLMVIDPQGMLRPCDVIPKNAFLPIGTVKLGITRDFSAELNRAAVGEHPDCGTCAWLKPCRGGCPGAALTDDENFYGKHAFTCALHTEMYPYLLERLSDSPRLQAYFNQHYYRGEYRWMLDVD